MNRLQYDEVIRGIFRGWFRMHGAGAKIPDFMHHDQSFSDADREHVMRLYAEARMGWDQPISVPSHVYNALMTQERIDAAVQVYEG